MSIREELYELGIKSRAEQNRWIKEHKKEVEAREKIANPRTEKEKLFKLAYDEETRGQRVGACASCIVLKEEFKLSTNKIEEMLKECWNLSYTTDEVVKDFAFEQCYTWIKEIYASVARGSKFEIEKGNLFKVKGEEMFLRTVAYICTALRDIYSWSFNSKGSGKLNKFVEATKPWFLDLENNKIDSDEILKECRERSGVNLV